MTIKDLGELIDHLRAAGAGLWIIVLVVFGVALIFKGPEYFNVIYRG